MHGSEKALAEMTCDRVAGEAGLVGGLGMGFTLTATLAAIGWKTGSWSRNWCRKSLTGTANSSVGPPATRRALKLDGLVAVWSAFSDRRFTKRVEQAGFEIELQMVRPHRASKGARHYIWFATRGC